MAANSSANRVARWIQDNRVAVVALTATVAVAGAAGAYLLSSRPPAGSGGSTPSSASKKKKAQKKKKSAARPEGPILDDADDASLARLAAPELSRLPPAKRASVANYLKGLGNKAYASKAYREAIAHYTKAIAAEPAAVYFSNRAACYANLGEPKNVIADCNEALKLDHTYTKALNRRAVAYEQLGELSGLPTEAGREAVEALAQSLADFTAVAILGHFRDAGATASVERVLKKLASGKAKQVLATREPRLPSPTFVTAYFDSFRAKPAPEIPLDAPAGDRALAEAFGALGAADYTHALSRTSAAIEAGLSTPALEAIAYNLRGTFFFVMGLAVQSLADFDRSTELAPDYVQSWVKKASVHVELGDKDAAMRDFERAIEIDAADPDVYYHRGQVHFILGDYDAAIADYEKSTSLDDRFIFSQVQQAVAQYKQGQIARSTGTFRRILKSFDDMPEAYNYYGELMLDQQRHEDAVANFDKAIALERAKPRGTNVLALINKALVIFQWKQDHAGAEKLCLQALETDPDCDVAIATLAQLSLQQSKIPEAIEYFRRSAEVARTEPELINAITYEYASRAQLQFIRDYPEQGAALSQMASALM